MKAFLLTLPLLLPVAVSAQKLVASHEPVTYYVGKQKSPLYRSAADTASGKSGYNLVAESEASVVGDFSPRWLIVKREGFLYLTPSTNLINPVAPTTPPC